MKYKINIPDFEGPLDLLLHLIKESNIDIMDISIDSITKQYLDYIHKMEQMNLNIASEYLVMAAELIEIKAKSLLPQNNNEDEEEIDPKQQLIEKLIDYQKYKELSSTFKELENTRKEIFTKEVNSLNEFNNINEDIDYGVNLNDLVEAFSRVLQTQNEKQPLNTKITNKDYSIGKRCIEIKNIINSKKKIKFIELFDNFSKDYIVITFLAVLNLSKKGEIELVQTNNFENIDLIAKENN